MRSLCLCTAHHGSCPPQGVSSLLLAHEKVASPLISTGGSHGARVQRGFGLNIHSHSVWLLPFLPEHCTCLGQLAGLVGWSLPLAAPCHGRVKCRPGLELVDGPMLVSGPGLLAHIWRGHHSSHIVCVRVPFIQDGPACSPQGTPHTQHWLVCAHQQRCCASGVGLIACTGGILCSLPGFTCAHVFLCVFVGGGGGCISAIQIHKLTVYNVSLIIPSTHNTYYNFS